MDEKSTHSLRLWPAWLICVAMIVPLVLSIMPTIPNGPRFLILVGGPTAALLLFATWVAFGSRLAMREKLILAHSAVLFPILSILFAFRNDATRSAMFVYGVPMAILLITMGLTIWASHRKRILAAIGLMAAGWALFPLVRIDGFDGDYIPEFTWRWTSIHEESLPALKSPADQSAASADLVSPVWDGGNVWPMFRGANGDGTVDDHLGEVDWQGNPPKELWRIDIGPGWGSFAYHHGRLFTQEQRGELEYVTAYWAEDGRVAWSHSDPSRFEEIVSGAGPRSTPTIAEGRVYAMGARALLNCLDETTGEVIWTRNLHDELDAPIPQWAFAGSPLVVGNLVICYVGSEGDNGLIALNCLSGEKVWGFPSTGENYTTARLLNLCGVDCLVFCDSNGVHGLEPTNGKEIWTYKPTLWKAAPYVDPLPLGPTTILVSNGDGVGMTKIAFALDDADDAQWTIVELWKTNHLRPSFNDSLHLYDTIFGFSQNIFGCISQYTGSRFWHGGRFGFGQAILLKNSQTIIVISERGELVFLRATGEKLDILHRQRLFNDKTWNHPIVVGNRLFVRNGKTAVCIELAPARG